MTAGELRDLATRHGARLRLAGGRLVVRGLGYLTRAERRQLFDRRHELIELLRRDDGGATAPAGPTADRVEGCRWDQQTARASVADRWDAPWNVWR